MVYNSKNYEADVCFAKACEDAKSLAKRRLELLQQYEETEDTEAFGSLCSLLDIVETRITSLGGELQPYEED